MRDFAGILGLAVALNGGVAVATSQAPEPEKNEWMAGSVRSGFNAYDR